MTKAPFTKKSERLKDLLGLVHSNVCGPMSISAKDGSRYFITLLMISVDMAMST
jgi:hypothetical protein